MAILRNALTDADYRRSSVVIALQDTTILGGLRKNYIESFHKAFSKVVNSFSNAIPQPAFEIQKISLRFHKTLQQLCSRALFEELLLRSWNAFRQLQLHGKRSLLRVLSGLPPSVPPPQIRQLLCTVFTEANCA